MDANRIVELTQKIEAKIKEKVQNLKELTGLQFYDICCEIIDKLVEEGYTSEEILVMSSLMAYNTYLLNVGKADKGKDENLLISMVLLKSAVDKILEQ